MNKIASVNNDYDTRRSQRNMTDTQKRNYGSIKEGKIVNAFVKDPLLSLDETCDTLLISKNQVELPEKVFEYEKKKNNSLLYMGLASGIVMGLIGGFTGLIRRFSEKKFESTEEYLLPGITRNHCINNEIHQGIFSMIQSPNRRTILSAIGVITLAATAFMAKTFIDGYKEIWIKKREADIQKNLQENLIAVETQSFSGKIQIIRNLLSTKAKLFETGIKESIATKPKETHFAGKENKKRDNKNHLLPFLTIGGITVSGIVALGYLSMKNLRKSEEFIKKGVDNTKKGLDNIIDAFNTNKPINPIEDYNGKILTGKDAYKQVIENMLETIYATPEQIEEYVNKMNLERNEKTELINRLKHSMNCSTEKVNSAMGGSGRNKITYFSHVNDSLSFFYDWLMNPKNPQFKNLFLGISGVSALTYGGSAVADAIKQVEVKKYNAQTELNLQKRLVSTELRNFKAKKESVIEPLCDEFENAKQSGKSAEELKILADNILFEIKNGPPFVYS